MMPNTFYYLRGALGDTDLLETHEADVNRLLTRDYTQKNIEKLTGHNVYSLRTGNKNAGRLLFTTTEVADQNYLLALEYLPTHDYQNSRFLKSGVLAHYLERHEAVHADLVLGAAAEAGAADAPPAAGVAESAFVFEAAPMPTCALSASVSDDEDAPITRALEYYQGKMITLSASQEEALNLTLPAVVSGVAGSGKSCIAVSMLSDFVSKAHPEIEDGKPRVLYVTEQPHLVSEIQAAWDMLPIAKAEAATVDILSYQDLLQRHYIPEITWMGFEQFHQWYEGYRKHEKNKSVQLPEPGTMYQEFRTCVAYTEAEYLALGQRHSLLPKEAPSDKTPSARQVLYRAYLDYQKSFAPYEIDASFYPGSHEASYDLIVVDEAQDFSLGNLRYLHALAHHQAVVFCMDSHQSLKGSLSVRPYLLNTFNASHTLLETSHRCPANVVLAANEVISLKNRLTGGLADKEEIKRIEGVSEEKAAGEVYCLNTASLQAHSEWLSAEKDAHFAVIANAAHHEAAKAYFNTDLVFTPEGIKGLEFKVVVVYRLFEAPLLKKAGKALLNAGAAAENTHRAKAGKGDKQFAPAFNRIYTAYTRTLETLLIFEENTRANQVFLEPLRSVFTEKAFTVETLSGECIEANWIDTIKKVLRVGNEPLAESLFNRHVSSEPEAFDNFIRILQTPVVAMKPKRAITLEPAGSGGGMAQTSPSSDEAASAAGKENSDSNRNEPKRTAKNSQSVSPQSASESPKKSIFEYARILHKAFTQENLREALKHYDLEKLLSEELHLKSGKRSPKKSQHLIEFIQLDISRIHLLGEWLEDKSVMPLINLKSLSAFTTSYDGSEGTALAFKAMLMRLKKRIITARIYPLGWFVEKGDIEEIERLLADSPEEVNKIQGSAVTPAYIAAANNHAAVIDALAKHGVDFNQGLTDGGITPAMIAALNGHVTVIDALAKHGADLNQGRTGSGETPAYIAAEEGHVAVIDVLARHGADLNRARSDNGATPAHAAAINAHVDVIDALGDHKVDLNQRRTDVEVTPAYLAAQRGHAAVIDALAKHRVDLNQGLTDSFITPAFVAAERGHVAVIDALAKHGADLDQGQRGSGITPAFIAAQNGHVAVIHALANYGVNLNQGLTDNGATPAMIAAQQGHVAVIDALAVHGADLNQGRTDSGETPVFIAAANGHIAVIDALAKHGADLNQARTDTGAKPVFVAAEVGHVAVIDALARHAIDLNQGLTDTGETPAYIAAANGHIAVIDALAKHGANLNQVRTDTGATPVFVAAQQGHVAVIHALAKHDSGLKQARTDGVTPAMIAAENGHVDVIDALVKHGADLNQGLTDTGETPAYIAAQRGHAAVIDALAKHGADLNQARTDTGETPAFVAAENGHVAVIDALAKYEADLNQGRTGTGKTPAYIAAQNGHVDVIDALAKHGADLNQARTDTRGTPAFIAAENGHVDVFHVLAKHGVDLNQGRADSGVTPAYIAAQMGHVAVIDVLANYGVNLNQGLTDNGGTPAMIAAQQEHVAVIDALAKYDADLNQGRTDNGATPAYIAAQNGHVAVIDALAKHGADLNHSEHEVTMCSSQGEPMLASALGASGLFSSVSDVSVEHNTHVTQGAP
jgi:ankyrin repeat protein